MNKVFNKLIVFSFGIAVISLFGTIPSKANAQYSSYGGVSPYSYYGSGTNAGTTQPPTTVYVPTPTYVPTYVPVPEPVPLYINPAPTPTPTVYSNSSNPNPPIAKKAVAKAKPKTAETNSELTANAVFGSDTFLPSGLLQWILFAILVLLIIILVRKIYGADQKYHAAPLKHD